MRRFNGKRVTVMCKDQLLAGRFDLKFEFEIPKRRGLVQFLIDVSLGVPAPVVLDASGKTEPEASFGAGCVKYGKAELFLLVFEGHDQKKPISAIAFGTV